MLFSTLVCVLGWLLAYIDVTTAKLGVVEAVIHTCSTKSFQRKQNFNYSCQEKIDIILKTSVKLIQKESQLVTVTDVYSPDDKESVRLLSPLLIHVHLNNARLLYPLKYLQTVNNKAYEVFFHKDNTDQYQGCKESLIGKMCGRATGTNVNKGFCCPCNAFSVDVPYHIRSGQDCSNTHTPLKIDPATYHSSTHCIRYDSVWYHVYEAKKPFVEYDIAVEVYTVDGAGTLNPVTQDNMVVGTASSSLVSSNNKVFVSILNVQVQPKNEDPLNYKRNILLIPQQSRKTVEVKNLPLQLQGNASEFLVLNKDNLAPSGAVCNKVGVSYNAFISQRHRCSKPAQSCLKNQPMQFWLNDIEKQLQRKATKYFLSGLADISRTPLVQQPAGLSLSLQTKGRLSANLMIQVQVNNTLPARQGNLAQISSITHTTEGKVSVVYVSVYNPGLVEETYTVLLHTCNTSLVPPKATRVSVHAHQSSNAVFRFSGLTTQQIVTCTVSVSNHLQYNVSERRFWFREGQICICIEDITCTCQSQRFHSNFSLEADVLPSTLEGYFSGPGDRRFVVLLMMLLLIILDLRVFVGFVKGLLSLAFPVHVGQCGLCLLLRGKPLSTYYEPELESFDVTYNKDGTPVHPVNDKPVQLLSRCELMFLNLFFGIYIIFLLPLYLLNRCRRLQQHSERLDLTADTEITVDSPESTERQSVRPESLSQIHLKTSAMSKSEKDLVLEIYKKQKQKLLHHKEVSKSLSKNEMGSYRFDITPPDSEIDESPSRRMTRIKETKVRHTGDDLFTQKQTLKTLLETDPVYCNLEGEVSVYLKNSGDNYSLCGTLTKEKRKFVFQLGDYTLQTYENVGYPKLLSRPQRILHPISFTLSLTPVGVHRMITANPLYPCLNSKV